MLTGADRERFLRSMRLKGIGQAETQLSPRFSFGTQERRVDDGRVTSLFLLWTRNASVATATCLSASTLNVGQFSITMY